MPEVRAGQTLPAGTLQKFGGLVTAYTPALTATTTNPTLGSGASTSGWWARDGDTVKGGFYIQFGTSGVAAGSGTYLVSLPVNILYGSLAQMPMGAGFAVDSSDATATGFQVISGFATGGTDVSTMRFVAEGTRTINAGAPWTWAASDQLSCSFCYPGDF